MEEKKKVQFLSQKTITSERPLQHSQIKSNEDLRLNNLMSPGLSDKGVNGLNLDTKLNYPSIQVGLKKLKTMFIKNKSQVVGRATVAQQPSRHSMISRNMKVLIHRRSFKQPKSIVNS